MPQELRQLHAEKSRIVRELFIGTADDNYITARWCFTEGMNIDYSWLAVHTLEKYMKAALLLNGRSGKRGRDENGNCRDFGHDIRLLYKNIEGISSDLLPARLEQPAELRVDSWRDETPAGFLERLYRNGNADNRYQIFGFLRHQEDLFKLDAMAFALRRLCVPLDAYFLGKWRPGRRNRTHREVLIEEPRTWVVSLDCKLERTVNGNRGEQLRDVLLNLNVPFAPGDFSHRDMPSVTAWRGSVIGRLILKPLEQAPTSDEAAPAAELCAWVLQNIRLPREVRKQLREALGRQAASSS